MSIGIVAGYKKKGLELEGEGGKERKGGELINVVL
jgi:hypothetical protein